MSNELFKQYSITKKNRRGYECKCIKGLWGVTAPTRQKAIDTGYYYFIQYYTDGEYDADGGLSKWQERMRNNATT